MKRKLADRDVCRNVNRIALERCFAPQSAPALTELVRRHADDLTEDTVVRLLGHIRHGGAYSGVLRALHMYRCRWPAVTFIRFWYRDGDESRHDRPTCDVSTMRYIISTDRRSTISGIGSELYVYSRWTHHMRFGVPGDREDICTNRWILAFIGAHGRPF